jgi:hypothetical protein
MDRTQNAVSLLLTPIVAILTNFKPTETTRNKVIEKELANRSTYQIQYAIVVIVKIVFKVWFVSLTP